jgi:hypothetical protein
VPGTALPGGRRPHGPPWDYRDGIGGHVVPIRRARTAPALLAAAIVAVLASGCAATGLHVTLSGFTDTATVITASCVAAGRTVTVRGELAGEGFSTTYSAVSALIYDSKGAYLGDGESPVLSVASAQIVPFKFTVRVLGPPSSCTISWGFGPASGSTGATSGGGSPSGDGVGGPTSAARG